MPLSSNIKVQFLSILKFEQPQNYHRQLNPNDFLGLGRVGRPLAISIVTVAVMLAGCGERKYTQCEQIIYVASQSATPSQSLRAESNQQPQELKIWLESARDLEQKAKNIRALSLNDSTLINYQDQLATVYQIYFQATYAAVEARENKNIAALAAARKDALKAGEIQQNLVKKINAYCLNS